MAWQTAQMIAKILASAPNTGVADAPEATPYKYTPVTQTQDDSGKRLAIYSSIADPNRVGSVGNLDGPVDITDIPIKPPAVIRPSSVTGAVGRGFSFVGDLFNPKTAYDFYASKASKLVDTHSPLKIGKTYRFIVTPIGSNAKILACKGKRATLAGHGIECLDTGIWKKDSKDIFLVVKIG